MYPRLGTPGLRHFSAFVVKMSDSFLAESVTNRFGRVFRFRNLEEHSEVGERFVILKPLLTNAAFCP